MKIAMVVPPWFSVPPATHGGIETLVHVLVEELVNRGEQVTLYSVGTSRTSGNLRSLYSTQQASFLWTSQHATVESAHALFSYQDIMRGEFDIVHDHSGVVGPTLGALLQGPPILHTVHGVFSETKRQFYSLLAHSPRIFFNTISHSQGQLMPELHVVATIYNATNPSLYPLVREKQEYLVDISRICPEKGCHLAIELARRAGLPLKLAGRIDNTTEGHRYFAEQIEPHLGGSIEYVGEVNLQEKVALLAHARAFVFPVVWSEPFGLVAIEALACGTPVIASSRGALPEIIRNGIDGFLAEGLDDMLWALDHIDAIDADNCRHRVEEAFSPGVMASRYQEVYRQIHATEHTYSIS